MNRTRAKAIAVLIVMGAAFGGAQAWKPRLHFAETHGRIDIETVFPAQFGEWHEDTRGPVQLVSPDAAALLKELYSATLSRTYVDGKGDRIMLSVAYGGDQSDATKAHRPEVCYPAQGFQLVSSQLGKLIVGTRELPVRRLVAKQGGRTEPISYWINVGERATVTGTQQKVAQLSYSMRGTVPDGMLVRVSNISSNADASFLLHEKFIDDLARAIDPSKISRVMGAPTP